MFEGSFGALATYLVDSGELSQKELDELRVLIEARETYLRLSADTQAGKPEGGV